MHRETCIANMELVQYTMDMGRLGQKMWFGSIFNFFLFGSEAARAGETTSDPMVCLRIFPSSLIDPIWFTAQATTVPSQITIKQKNIATMPRVHFAVVPKNKI